MTSSLTGEWCCPMCGTSTYGDPRPLWCPTCSAVGLARRPVRRPAGDHIAGAARTLSAAAACREAFDVRACPVTDIPWSAPCLWMAWGVPGAGKSTLGAQIIGACGFPALIASMEEDVGLPLARRLRVAGLQNRSDVRVSVRPSADELVAAAQAGEAILVDSVSASVLRAGDLRGLLAAGSPLVVFTLHATKAGAYRGDSSLAHEADVILQVDAGEWVCSKSRHGPVGRSGRIRGIDDGEGEP